MKFMKGVRNWRLISSTHIFLASDLPHPSPWVGVEVLEGGGGLAGTPLFLWSPKGPGRRWAENFKLKSSWREGAEAKCWLSASIIGRGGLEGGPGGYPPPPLVYARSNTSLGGGFFATKQWPGRKSCPGQIQGWDLFRRRM